ncbi:hypothetical protein [Rhizobium sp. PP-F2F-G48]|uniref:hypothetical protein n=1 Tax=Rhizobium sp. PP-F2F-G48 TaxID=2135651 RepID=UPI00104FCAF1|nr:hypothetical protein [Rhizobium sp. PP-F2F-G48]
MFIVFLLKNRAVLESKGIQSEGTAPPSRDRLSRRTAVVSPGLKPPAASSSGRTGIAKTVPDALANASCWWGTLQVIADVPDFRGSDSSGRCQVRHLEFHEIVKYAFRNS